MKLNDLFYGKNKLLGATADLLSQKYADLLPVPTSLGTSNKRNIKISASTLGEVHRAQALVDKMIASAKYKLIHHTIVNQYTKHWVLTKYF